MKNLVFAMLIAASTLTLAGCSASVDIDKPHGAHGHVGSGAYH